jgi:hypothetical protein
MTSGYYRTSSPVTALPMIMRWISDVPSKIVKILEGTVGRGQLAEFDPADLAGDGGGVVVGKDDAARSPRMPAGRLMRPGTVVIALPWIASVGLQVGSHRSSTAAGACCRQRHPHGYWLPGR